MERTLRIIINEQGILSKTCIYSLTTPSLPLSSDLDAAGSYLAFQALESYGPCLQKSANEEAELYDLTDGFSVAALKVTALILGTDMPH